VDKTYLNKNSLLIIEYKTLIEKMKKRAGDNSNHHLNGHNLTFGQKAADFLTKHVGSWKFIIIIIIFISGWILLNITAYFEGWDPWPFIILNLCLSTLAALQTPLILLSQNRSNQRDRLRVEYDYQVDKKAEHEIQEIKKQLDRIERKIQ